MAEAQIGIKCMSHMLCTKSAVATAQKKFLHTLNAKICCKSRGIYV